MTGLETAFYIVGIVFMGIMILLMAAVVAAVFAIRAKIHEIERTITENIISKLGMVTNALNIGKHFAEVAKKIVEHRRAS